jgi:hypothetical protein
MKRFFFKKLQFLKKPVFLYFINPVAIFLIGLIFSIFLNPLSSLTLLVYPPVASDRITYPAGELLAKEKISGKFTALSNDLGIVSVRFYNFKRISSDVVLFRIKQKGARDWYYQNTYKVDQFQPNKFFTFGFPIIPDSQGKTYVFEVESLFGKHKDAIGVSKIKPTVVTSYQIPKYEIFSSKNKLLTFIAMKTTSFATYHDAIIAALFYFLPLLYYLFCLVLLNLLLRRKPVYIVPLLFIVSLYDAIVAPITDHIFYVIVVSFWIIAFLSKRIEAAFLYIIALIFLLLLPFTTSMNQQDMSGNIGRWVYIFLLLGFLFSIIQTWRTARLKLDTYLTFIKK